MENNPSSIESSCCSPALLPSVETEMCVRRRYGGDERGLEVPVDSVRRGCINLGIMAWQFSDFHSLEPIEHCLIHTKKEDP